MGLGERGTGNPQGSNPSIAPLILHSSLRSPELHLHLHLHLQQGLAPPIGENSAASPRLFRWSPRLHGSG
jgi:hypothetical protein